MNFKQILEQINDLKKHYSGTLSENIESLQTIVKILAELVEVVADARIKGPQWRYHQQTLIGKIIFTSNSILILSKGYEYAFYKKTEKVHIIDYQSIFILTRSLIEAYVTLCYIYYNKLTDDEKYFRYRLWEVSGLITRQNFEVTHNDNLTIKKQIEKEQIDQIINEIDKMEEFRAKIDKKKLSMYGQHRLQSWHELIKESNLNTRLFGMHYSFLSSYAHSEFLSILQISQSNMNSKSDQTYVYLALSIVRMINSLSIDYYTKTFKSAEIIFNTYPDSITMPIEMWKNIAINYIEKEKSNSKPIT